MMIYGVGQSHLKNFLLTEGNSYIKKLEDEIKDPLNNYCVECGEENPQYISINNAVFLCRDCVQNHLKFPKNISIIKRNNIKSLTLHEIQYLLCGGNRSLLNFICNEYPKLAELPSNILYRTQAMIYYREYLKNLINGSIPPRKPSIKSAYKTPILFDSISKKENNIDDIYNNENDNNSFNDNFFKTGYSFIKNEKQKLYNNRLTINSNINNSIGNKAINYDNYYINRPRQVNFQNNNNIIIGNKMDFIDNMNINKNKILHTSGKINNKDNTNINDYINNINFNNVNTDVYIRPKLILTHNSSKTSLFNKNNLNQRKSNHKINKQYFYSQNKPIGTRIDSIQLYFEKGNKNKERNINKINYSNKIYKKSKKYLKSNKNLHKSLSQKIFNNNNYSHTNKNFVGNNNKYSITTQIENYQYIPNKNSKINYIKNQINKISISNNEEFQIISHKNNTITSNDINSIKGFINSHSQINIIVNKKNNVLNTENKKENSIKEKKRDNSVNEKKIKKVLKLEMSKKENIKKFISKCNKNRIILREKEKTNSLINKINNKEKDKDINNNKINNNTKIKKDICNTTSKDILKQSNSNQTKLNDNKNETKNISIRNRYKGKIKPK